MNWFSKSSLRSKITVLLTAVATLALSLSFVLTTLQNIESYKQNLVSQSHLIANIIGEYSVADFVFSDQGAAKKSLRKFENQHNIVAIALYDKDNRIFTQIGKIDELKQNSKHDEITLGEEFFRAIEPVSLDSKNLGFVHVIISTKTLRDSLMSSLATSATLFIILLIMLFFISNWIQQIISSPIINLTKDVKHFSKAEGLELQYSIDSNDEVHILEKSFQDMLNKLNVREAQLSKKSAEFEAIFNSMPDAVMLADLDRRIIRNNPAVFQLFGYEDDDLIGNTTEMLYADKNDYINQGKKRYRTGGDTRTGAYEVDYQRKNGEVFVSESIGAQVKNSDGEHIGFIAIFRDITDRKQTEEKIQQLNKELEKRVEDRTKELVNLNKELEAFSYSVSHDLRSPLRSINGYSMILLDDFAENLDQEAKDYLNRIRSSSNHMAQLINDLLNLSRVNQSQIEISKVNLSEMAINIIDTLKSETPDRKIDWVVKSDMSAQGDFALLQIVLTNLLSNAWKYTSKNEDAIIEFSETTIDNDKVFYVKDNGVGFDMQFAGKLFGAFQRMHQKGEFEGTGIGLATVKRILQRHHGDIWAEAEVNKGATFYFKIT